MYKIGLIISKLMRINISAAHHQRNKNEGYANSFETVKHKKQRSFHCKKQNSSP